MRLVTIGLSLALTGCSGGDDDDGCAPQHRIGTYLVTFFQRSGDCGPLEDDLVQVTDPAFLPAQCRPNAPDVWSEGDCRLERDYTCTVAQGSVTTFAITTERGDGSMLGTAQVTVFDSSGAQLCSSIYEIVYARR